MDCCLSSAKLSLYSVISLYYCRVHLTHLYLYLYVFVCVALLRLWYFSVLLPRPQNHLAHLFQSSSNQSSEVGAFLWFFSPSILQFMNLEGFIDMFWGADNCMFFMTLVSLFFHQSKLFCKIQDLVYFPDRCWGPASEYIDIVWQLQSLCFITDKILQSEKDLSCSSYTLCTDCRAWGDLTCTTTQEA